MADIDLGKVKRNVAKMVGMGAPETDIDAYISSEGTSIDAIKAFKDVAPQALTGAAMDAAQGYRPPTQPRAVNPDGSPREGVDLAALEAEAPPPRVAGPLAVGAGAAEAGKGMVPQGLSGVNEGIANMVGFPVDAVNSAMRGFGLPMSDAPFLGSQSIKGMMGAPLLGTDMRMIYPPNDDPADQFARATGRGIGSAAVAGPATGMGAIPTAVMGAGSGVGGGIGSAISGGSPVGEAVGGAIGGGLTGGLAAAVEKYAAGNAARASVPTVDELTSQAAALYGQAERNGVTASQAQTTALRDAARQVASAEGLVSPTGRVAGSYPKISDALNMLDDYATGTMTPTQMMAVRKTLRAAAQSADGSESRIGTLLLKQFDDFVAPLAPEFKEANALYTRAMRGEDLDTLRELAASRAGQFSGSGFENALRTEYRGLERKIIKGQESWPPEMQDAITRVAQGTPTSNLLRNVGRMAPTGAVTFGTTVGVPYMIGSSVGGPAVGTAAAGAAALAGYGARAGATMLGNKYATIAEQMARSGGVLPAAASDSPGARAVAAALLAAQNR